MSSIATRTGDDGSTSLLFGRRVRKDDLLVEAYGTVDELSSALGLARATARDPWIAETLLSIQKDLVPIMGDLAVDEADRPRYLDSKLPKVDPGTLDRLDQVVAQLEARGLSFDGWATPGATLHAAALDLARAVCRRAERRIVGLDRASNPLILQILNRLSDTLWLMARLEENQL
ncbi:MAG: cob(I)yrinic acid a,c-diamide adenosyltransferase [Verrucomicrobiia bacterium]